MPQLNQSAADYDTFGVKNTFYRVNDRAQVGYKNFDCLTAFFVAVCGFFENSVAVEAAAVKLVCRSHKPGCRNILFGAADLAAVTFAPADVQGNVTYPRRVEVGSREQLSVY